MKTYAIKLLNITVFATIFIGVPHLLGSYGHMWWSWLAAIIVITYLNEEG